MVAHVADAPGAALGLGPGSGRWPHRRECAFIGTIGRCSWTRADSRWML